MGIDVMPFVVFIFVTTFTPGPGNLTSAAMGMNYGYRGTVPFLSGIVAGHLIIMALCAALSSTLLMVLPTVEPALRLLGACYILWLALGVARTDYRFDTGGSSPMVFTHGFCLQVLNPKAIIFGLTVYTTFLSAINREPFLLGGLTLLMTLLTFCSVSVWAFGGAGIRRHLHLGYIRKGLNFILAALLIYCAATLSGLFSASL